MLALHAAWTRDDHLALWAEDPELPRTSRRRVEPRPHPFAADPAKIAVLALDGVEVPGVRKVAMGLPSAKAGPVRSPHLWTDDPVDDVVGFRTWTVEAAALPARAALAWLLALDERSGVVVGDTVRYLAQIARFAVDLVGRGQIVPGVVRDADGWRARWRPYTADPDDAARRMQLVRGMPAALRTADVDGAAAADPPGARQAAEVFDAALMALVDRCARDAAPSGKGARPIAASPSRGSPEDAWVRALTAADPALGPVPGLDAFAAKLDAWMSAAGVRAEGFRTCFRIGAPQDDGPWRLDFLVQAADDPSLLVEAADVWRTGGAVLRAAGRELRDPQEWLLTDLGRASRLAPSVHAGLRAARPDGLDLDAEGAWTFLREAAPLLARSGFGILAPKWWGRPGARLGLRMRASPTEPTPKGQGSGLSGAAPSAMGLDALLSVQWEVVLGDDALPADELERLAALKAPLVRIRGQWVELRPEDIEAALAFYAEPPATEPIAARDALRVGLGLAAAPNGARLPITGLVADGWLGELLSDAREARFAPVPAPAGFGATLRPYQERGLGWLLFHDRLGLGACLADDMGLGKTVQLLALLAHERSPGASEVAPAPTLLVCPMSLVGNWQREAARFAPNLRVVVHHGAGRASRVVDAAEGADLVITTYALAARDVAALSAVRWGRVVLDEAQNIKNAATRQAKAIHALPAPRRIALTGTPVENRLSELWSILAFLNPGLLGTAHAFRNEFAIPVERHGNEAVSARLREITAPFLLRRVKTDRSIVADLPSKFEVNEACTLTREQATLYKAVVDELMAALADKDGPARRGAVLAAMTRLKQVCDHPALLLQDRSALPGRSGKLARLEEILDTVVANGERALVFTQFAELGHPLKAHLQERLGREVAFLHGGTPRADRDAMVTRFATPSGPPVFLLSLKAGGTGLNLVAANHVVHFDRWWNPAVEDQATDRAFRLGQTKDVQVRKLVCLGTLEERIDVMIEQKRALAGKVVGAGEGWLADLSTAAIRELVALADDAVAEEG